jgi:hypothetical protein
VATLVLAAIAIGGFALYKGQSDEINDLRGERNRARAENAALTIDLEKSQTATKTANAKLVVANKNIKQARKEAAAAKKAATAQYGQASPPEQLLATRRVPATATAAAGMPATTLATTRLTTTARAPFPASA